MLSVSLSFLMGDVHVVVLVHLVRAVYALVVVIVAAEPRHSLTKSLAPLGVRVILSVSIKLVFVSFQVHLTVLEL